MGVGWVCLGLVANQARKKAVGSQDTPNNENITMYNNVSIGIEHLDLFGDMIK